MYRLGWPGAHIVSRLGFPLEIKVEVIFDKEAKVFVGTSRDLDGLVLEAETVDEMIRELRDVLSMMLESEKWAPRDGVATRLSIANAVPCA